MDESKTFSSTLSLTDEIVAIMRQRILKGEYRIGEKIKEKQILEEFQVSRTPIREAFKILEEEGLLEYKKNRGCFARGFTKRDVDDVYAVRKALETLAIEWACHRITPEHIEALKDQCDMMEFYASRQDGKHVMELNSEFHDIIYDAAGSRFMAQVLRSYKGYIDQARKDILSEKVYMADILKEHRRILKALKEGDVEEAKKATEEHIDLSRKRAGAVYNMD